MIARKPFISDNRRLIEDYLPIQAAPYVQEGIV